MPHQNGAGPDHRGDGGEAQSSVLGWLATATDSRPHTKPQPVRADLIGADTAVAAGITATGPRPAADAVWAASGSRARSEHSARGLSRHDLVSAGALDWRRGASHSQRRPRRETPLRDPPSRSRWLPELRGSAAHAFKRWGASAGDRQAHPVL